VKKDGQTVREGDKVRGPRKGEKLGELLASLDKRDYIEQSKVTRSSLAEAKQQVNAARAARNCHDLTEPNSLLLGPGT
jgi:hypothetical protein